MKFTVTRSKLLEGLQKVQNVVSTKSTFQILSNVHIRTDNNLLWLATTDMDISITCSVEAETHEAGATTLPVRRLTSIVRELPEGAITFDINEEDNATVQCASSFFKILGLPVADFPPLPKASGEFFFVLDKGVLREMLAKTAYAASLDETRRALNGVLFSFKEGKLILVATDGRRLALIEHEVDFPEDKAVDFILPSKAVNELKSILADSGQLKINAQKNQAIFEYDSTTFTSKLVDAVYPNYRQVIPGGCEQRIVLPREDLIGAIRRVSLVNTDKSSSARFIFAGNQLCITSNSPEVGEARETLPVKYNGKEISIVFNPEYVMDPIRNLDNDEVAIELSDSHAPALIKCDLPFLYVLMPLRV